MSHDFTSLTGLLLDAAKAHGADYADVILVNGASQSVEVREGKLDTTEREDSFDIGLRVLVGKKQAIVSTASKREADLKKLAEQAVLMARTLPEDLFNSIAEPELIAKNFPDLNLCENANTLDIDRAVECALAAEAAGESVDGVSMSDGAHTVQGRFTNLLHASNGFFGQYDISYTNMSCAMIAGEGENMVTDYDYDVHINHDQLNSPESIGRTAAKRAVNQLNPRPGKTGQFPVIYDNRVSTSLVLHLARAANGRAIAKGTSFLKDKLGQKILSPEITITDDPLRPQGLKSSPFDGECLPHKAFNLIEEGILNELFLDLSTAKQLNMTPNGRARRDIGTAISPGSTNLWLHAGQTSPEDMIADIKEGFLVTHLMGSSISMSTGDYSRGASGFWIENGKIAYPVVEMTIAGNLKEMYASMIAANDLTLRYGTDSPSILIPKLSVAAG